MVIAIDGPAGAGKSTVARALAERLGFTYLDSGAMYRAVALATLRAGANPDSADDVEPIARAIELRMAPGVVFVAGEDVSAAIREPDVTAVASRVSVHPGVRAAMVDRQRELVADGGWVAEGRDIGTVVCPESPLKVFLTADESERAARRAAQTGRPAGEILAEQQERDARDREREHGALVAAPDSVEVETTGLGIEEVVERVAALAAERGLLDAATDSGARP
jgi:cytidylate kinase